MELTSYFSDRQRLTLKSLWIPAIIMVILGITITIIRGEDMYSRPGTYTVAFLLVNLQWSFVYGWEHIYNKDYKKAIIIMAGFFLLNMAFDAFLNKAYRFLPAFIDVTLLSTIWSALQVAGVCYISGKRNFWQIGLVAGLIICYTTDVPSNPLSYIRMWPFNLSSISAEFILPFLVYGWIYLAENYFNEKGYNDIITSKIQVTSGQEYRFLYPLVAVSCWVIIFQFSGFLKVITSTGYSWSEHSGFQTHTTLTRVVDFVMEVSIFYITAALTRNIVISRMNTIANNNGWLYLLHFIPVLNIIAWIIVAKAPSQHNSKSENSVFYLAERNTAIKYFIIGLGVLSTIWSLWGVYQLSARFGASTVTGILFLILFVKLVNYFFLDKGKNAVILLVVLTTIATLVQFIVSIRTGRSEFALLMASVLSYFFLIEIFYPELEQADTSEVAI
ncbi:hypothetical protein [Chitinophaga sp.]|uniref:hypothetical protein n=1 Tax=Chitinophaga sp. TaxID=1869181 RepID=UPI0031D76976